MKLEVPPAVADRIIMGSVTCALSPEKVEPGAEVSIVCRQGKGWPKGIERVTVTACRKLLLNIQEGEITHMATSSMYLQDADAARYGFADLTELFAWVLRVRAKWVVEWR